VTTSARLYEKHCKCGHLVEWFTKCEPGDDDGLFMSDLKSHSDVIERPCRHHNGTVIEHCARCDRRVGIWGFGPAGGMECTCWSRWWERLYWRTIGRLILKVSAK
jgi:hypothetical protein